jgi:hypothetical protein
MAKSRKGHAPKKLDVDAFREAVVLIPLSYNDGTEVSPDKIVEIQDEIFSAFTGWTIEGQVKGAYRMASGEKKVEELLKMSIILRSSQLPVLESMIAAWAAQLGQETMLLKVADLAAKFIPPRERGESS